MLAVAHVTEIVHARGVIEDGVDGLVHTFIDELADPAFIQLAVERGIFLVGTLSAEEAFVTNSGGASLIVDLELGPYLTPEEIASLLTPGPPSFITAENLAIGRENVRRLHEAAVRILAGTDQATHGVSIHRDLELLVEAGLSPKDALEAATGAPAAAFGLADCGRIAPGLRADLVLVEAIRRPASRPRGRSGGCGRSASKSTAPTCRAHISTETPARGRADSGEGGARQC